MYKRQELLDGMRKGKDVTDTETDASMENKNIKYNISKKVINFRLWNFRTSKVEDMDTIIYRKIKNDEKADIYILSNEDMTIIIPSKLFMYNKKYFKRMSDGIDISIPFSRCKAIWIRDISDETDTSQKRDINEHYEKYLEAIKVDPNYNDAYKNLGLAYYTTGRLKESKLYYQKYSPFKDCLSFFLHHFCLSYLL